MERGRQVEARSGGWVADGRVHGTVLGKATHDLMTEHPGAAEHEDRRSHASASSHVAASASMNASSVNSLRWRSR
ncbi:MAG: hypothetical protein ACYDHH_34445, partial [Solirubrobacteraceae bacterium]